MHYPDELSQEIAKQQRQFTNKCIGAQAAAQGAAIGGGLSGLAKPDFTWILIEGLKRLQGGQQVLAAYDAAAGANKCGSIYGGQASNLAAYSRDAFGSAKG